MGAVDTLVVQTLEKFLTSILAKMEMTPESAKAKVLEISNTVLSWEGRLKRIEENQRALMNAAGIPYIEGFENVTESNRQGESDHGKATG